MSEGTANRRLTEFGGARVDHFVRGFVWVLALTLLALSDADAKGATPNSTTTMRLLMYRLDPTLLAIVPLQDVMTADLKAAGDGAPWPDLRAFMESGDQAGLPPPWRERGQLPPEVTNLPFFNAPGPAESFVLPAGGRIGETILGVGASSMSEIAEHPTFLTLRETRIYVLSVLDRMSRAPEIVDREVVARLGKLLMDTSPAATQYAAQEILRSNSTLIKNPTRAFMIGLITTQCAYNAAVLRDKKIDLAIRQTIAAQNVWDITTPDGQSWKNTLVKIPSGQWSSIYKNCRVFVQSLLLAGAKT